MTINASCGNTICNKVKREIKVERKYNDIFNTFVPGLAIHKQRQMVSFLPRGRKILSHKCASRTPARFSLYGCARNVGVQRKHCACYATPMFSTCASLSSKSIRFLFDLVSTKKDDESKSRKLSWEYNARFLWLNPIRCSRLIAIKKVENKLRIILTHEF